MKTKLLFCLLLPLFLNFNLLAFNSYNANECVNYLHTYLGERLSFMCNYPNDREWKNFLMRQLPKLDHWAFKTLKDCYRKGFNDLCHHNQAVLLVGDASEINFGTLENSITKQQSIPFETNYAVKATAHLTGLTNVNYPQANILVSCTLDVDDNNSYVPCSSGEKVTLKNNYFKGFVKIKLSIVYNASKQLIAGSYQGTVSVNFTD